jgi:hypothetical protein
LHDPENQEVSVPSAASVVRKPSIIDRLKSFFGVKKEVNEIKISVTQEKFLKKSWKVSKKKLHQRKIVPVIIWDFGGQDVFYSTHQNLSIMLGFLTTLAALGTDTSLFSGSFSDDCCRLLTAPAAVGTDTSLFSVSVRVDCCSLLKASAAVGTDTSLFSVSFSDDCCSLLKEPAAVGTDTSLYSGSFSDDCCSLHKAPAAVVTDNSLG